MRIKTKKGINILEQAKLLRINKFEKNIVGIFQLTSNDKLTNYSN